MQIPDTNTNAETSLHTFLRWSVILLFLVSSLPYVVFLLYDKWYNNGENKNFATIATSISVVNTVLQLCSMWKCSGIITSQHRIPPPHESSISDKAVKYGVKLFYLILMGFSLWFCKEFSNVLDEEESLDDSVKDAALWGRALSYFYSVVNFVFLITSDKLQDRQTADSASRLEDALLSQSRNLT